MGGISLCALKVTNPGSESAHRSQSQRWVVSRWTGQGHFPSLTTPGQPNSRSMQYGNGPARVHSPFHHLTTLDRVALGDPPKLNGTKS